MTPPMTHSEPAREAVAVPAGWKLVPVEPTRAMKDAVSRKVDDFAREHARLFVSEIWQDMLSASPAASRGEPVACGVYPPPETYGGSPNDEWTGRPPSAPAGVKVRDWLSVAKAAGEHGVRYRTNRALEAFLTDIRSSLQLDTQSRGPTYVVNCCNCGRIIDTREEKEGGDKWGHELSDKRWVCSPECFDAVTEPDTQAAAASAPAQAEASTTAVDVREALKALLDHVDVETCVHEETHRGGFLWTICDQCGRKWADDKGGFVPHTDAPAVARARMICEALPAPDAKGKR